MAQRHPTRVLVVTLLLLILAACQGEASQPWTKSASATTCNDWLAVMTRDQQIDWAKADRDFALSQARTDLARDNIRTGSDADWADMITWMCQDEPGDALLHDAAWQSLW